MVMEQTTKTLFLFIFLLALQHSRCIATSIAPSPSASQLDQALCEATSSQPNPVFQNYLGNATNELKSAARSKAHFKYYSAIDGYTPIVHVSYLCQADITRENCLDCVSRATKAAQSSCSEAVVYEDKCSFRYSDKSFYGRFDDSPSYVYPLYEPLDSSINVEQFNKTLNKAVDTILTNLRTNPKYGPKFNAHVAKVDGTNTKIYAWGECTWDLFQEDCRLCVHECASMLPAGKVGGRVMLPSCNFRYETKPFYNETSVVLSPPLPPPSPGGQTRSPPSPSSPNQPKRKKKVNGKAAAAGTGGGIAGLLLGSVATWAYQSYKTNTMQNPQDVTGDAEEGQGVVTLAELANDAKEGRSEPADQANDEKPNGRKGKPPPQMATGAKRNNEKRSPKP